MRPFHYPIFQMRKLRHRKVKYVKNNTQSWQPNPGILVSGSKCGSYFLILRLLLEHIQHPRREDRFRRRVRHQGL